jgi:uncharacterized RDD family membrane protein YckC
VTGPILASFGRRVSALIIDAFVIGVVALVVVGFANPNSTWSSDLTNSGQPSLLIALVSGVYCIGGWLIWTGTPAQRLLGSHVYRSTGPQALALEAAAVRWALLFGVAAIIGTLAIAIPAVEGILGFGQLAWLVVLIATTVQSPPRQGIHDKYAGSLVVRN